MNNKLLFSVSLFFLSFLAFSQVNILDSTTIPEELKLNANAVVRLNERNIVIESQQKMNETLRRVVTVLNEKGVENVYAFAGFDKYRKVKKIEAKIYNASGEEIKKIKKADFIDQSAVDGGTLYSDSRVLYMAYQPTSYPITFDFKYEVETKNTASIRPWIPLNDYFLSVEKDTYIINDKANLNLKTKHRNFEVYNVTTSNENQVLSYSLQNQKVIKPETLSPIITEITPYAMVSAEKFHYYGKNGVATNWKDFGDWVHEALLKGRQEISEATKQEVLSLVKGVDDPIEKAKRIYKYVQENTRYISVQVGIGGVQPIPALDVDRVKYGDCKGLTNYTQALLKVVGVNSYYTVVEAGDDIVDFEEDFVSLAQGNHIILAIPNNDDIIWVDCTSQKHPFGFIGDFTDNRNVLVVKEGDSKIVKTASYTNSENYLLTKANVIIKDDGGINASTEITSKGISYDNRFFLQDMSEKDIKDIYKEYWDNVNGLIIKSYQFDNDHENVTFKESITVEAKDYVNIKDDKLIISPNIFNKSSYVPKRYRNRKFPLQIQRGFQFVDNFIINIPSTYNVEKLPEAISIENKFGYYKVSYKFQENVLIYKRDFFVKKGNYSPEDYNAYRKFRRQVANHDKSVLIFNQL